ncbi:STAS domain-containing protein [Ramlibacter albus]|uniref:STAS domain-containing protein n=1 Tax=Ramlibacter albus TaxID=2079448 RepID=A0A923MAG0_9BURK|nr:STAS domain-containing protein [Ramlibacter albus]MBC5765482.1 STAS domain-containing protein [Ramlibacter albus]
MPPPKDEREAGLLSKVVRFVKNPTTNWADLGEQEAERESSYSKQMLKEMIERKRRNDFVRKREFDMLRKMRRSEVMAGQDPAARPSFFQSSMPSKPDDRATTLKKIDEIEAQMSMQWWKTKHGGPDQLRGAGGSSTNFPMSSHMPPDAVSRPVDAPGMKSTAYTRTAPQELAAAPTPAPQVDAPMLESITPMARQPAPPDAGPVGRSAPPGSSGIPRTPPMSQQAPLAAEPAAPAPAPARAPVQISPMSMGPPSEPGGTPSSAFSASKLFAIDVDEFAHDPELEEASIRFANGDDAGAEAGLLEVLGPNGARLNHDETWLTLFDLYRATGRQDRFETAAIDFAGRFGRSAPQWFSMPEIVGRMSQPAAAAAAAAPPAGQPVADWTCPATFGTQTLAAMNAGLAKAQQPWRLSWSKLTTIQEAAVEPLTRLFTQWAAQPVQLRFIGADAFEKVLKDATPSGDRGVNPAWWKLRMEVLRVMHRPDEFELVALDYCVTYEVSPPSWDSARCEYKPLQADGSYAGGHTIVGEAFRDSLTSGMSQGYGDTQINSQHSQMSNVSTVELAGQILGDATDALDLLESKLLGADVMVISCARLIRIDFSAAGTLLNWVTARQAEGRQVQFIEVHRLVAAFFNVIGISEHARVIPRHD